MATNLSKIENLNAIRFIKLLAKWRKQLLIIFISSAIAGYFLTFLITPLFFGVSLSCTSLCILQLVWGSITQFLFFSILPFHRYTKYRITSLEKNYMPKMIVPEDLGIPLDLLDMTVYK
jgi:hypothetical protein